MTPPAIRPKKTPPPRRKYDATEVRMIRAGLMEQAKARYMRRTGRG